MTVSIPHRIETGTAQPTNVPTLLRELGIDHTSVEKQKPALRDWLAHHPPNPMLRVSMRRNGYGLLLAENSVARDASDPATK